MSVTSEVKEWHSRGTYKFGDVCIFNGKIYRYVSNVTRTFGSENHNLAMSPPYSSFWKACINQPVAVPNDGAGRDGSLREVLGECWDDLVNKYDRMPPEDYSDMALITRKELGEYLARAALAAVSGGTAEMEGE